MSEALYSREGDLYLPSESAGGPWNADSQHGGAASALLARSIAKEADARLRPVRLTVDLPRVLPRRPVEVVVKPLRTGRRIALIEACLKCEGKVTSYARALFLLPAEAGEVESVFEPLPGPEGLETGSLADPSKSRFQGFHTNVEVKWLVREGPGTSAWLRMPMPVVAGEPVTPLERAAAISDFANALAHRAALGPGRSRVGFVNADLTLCLRRLPRGEWIGMRTETIVERNGTGFVEVSLFDLEGRFASCFQNRLAN